MPDTPKKQPKRKRHNVGKDAADVDSGQKGAILYMGAGWDALPVAFMAAEGYSHMIYVDGLPYSKYFTKTDAGYHNACSVAALMAAVRRRLEHLGCDLKEENASNGSRWTFLCSGPFNARLDYFYNTKDVMMQKCHMLPSLLPRVTALYISGYSPSESVLCHEVLPAVRDIYASQLCWEDVEEISCLDQADLKKELNSYRTDHLSSDSEYDFDPDMLDPEYGACEDHC